MHFKGYRKINKSVFYFKKERIQQGILGLVDSIFMLIFFFQLLFGKNSNLQKITERVQYIAFCSSPRFIHYSYFATFALFLSLSFTPCGRAHTRILLFLDPFDSVRHHNPLPLNVSAMFFPRAYCSCSYTKHRIWFYFFLNPVYHLCFISI